MNPIKSLLYHLPKNQSLSPEALQGHAESQALAYACAKNIAKEIKEGWTEAQTARLMDVYLRDYGVRNFFHKSFVWFGERARFDGVNGLRDFLPTNRPLKPGECIILDTAPVYKGYPADIGYSCSLGENEELRKGREFLGRLRVLLLEMFNQGTLTGGDICEATARHITQKGYDVVHHRYPGAVLGHRLHPMSEGWHPPTFNPFGWEVFTRFFFEGIYPDLLNKEHRGKLAGAWAIEPHFGGKGFGCKFEEILIVDEQGARWLSPEIPW